MTVRVGNGSGRAFLSSGRKIVRYRITGKTRLDFVGCGRLRHGIATTKAIVAIGLSGGGHVFSLKCSRHIAGRGASTTVSNMSIRSVGISKRVDPLGALCNLVSKLNICRDGSLL